MDRVTLQEALEHREAVLKAFVAPDSSLRSIPTKSRKRLVVLDLVAGQFEPGRRYSEIEANALVRAFHPDVAALRRYLVEEGFVRRAEGVYWRA